MRIPCVIDNINRQPVEVLNYLLQRQKGQDGFQRPSCPLLLCFTREGKLLGVVDAEVVQLSR